jgi:hypothetical protein
VGVTPLLGCNEDHRRRPPVPRPKLGGVARGQCLSTGIRQRRHDPPVGRLEKLHESFSLKQSSRPDLVGMQDYALLVACCLQDAPHGGCKCHWSPCSRFWMKPSTACRALQAFYRNSCVSSISGSRAGFCALSTARSAPASRNLVTVMGGMVGHCLNALAPSGSARFASRPTSPLPVAQHPSHSEPKQKPGQHQNNPKQNLWVCTSRFISHRFAPCVFRPLKPDPARHTPRGFLIALGCEGSVGPNKNPEARGDSKTSGAPDRREHRAPTKVATA